MRGEYTAQIKISALAASKSLMTFQVPATKEIDITSIDVTTVGSNLTNQNLEVALDRITAVGSLAGSAVTPNPEENGDAASAVTVLGNITVEPTTYGARLDYQGAPSLSGYHYGGIPEERANCPPSGAIGLRLLNTPTSADFVVQVKYTEKG